MNCAYLLPASTYTRRTIWDAMFSSSSGSTFATKWALERANEWNDLRAINPALRFAAALDDDTSLMTGRSTLLKNVDEEEQRHLSIQTSRDVAITHVVAAAWSNGVDDEASMDRENYAVKEDDVLHAISISLEGARLLVARPQARTRAIKWHHSLPFSPMKTKTKSVITPEQPLRVFEEEPNLCLADSLTSRRKLSRRKICCPYTKRLYTFA